MSSTTRLAGHENYWKIDMEDIILFSVGLSCKCMNFFEIEAV